MPQSPRHGRIVMTQFCDRAGHLLHYWSMAHSNTGMAHANTSTACSNNGAGHAMRRPPLTRVSTRRAETKGRDP